MQTTVAELVRAHAATRMHKPRTAARIDSMIRNHLEAVPLGARRASAVRPGEVQAWVADQSQHLAPLTMRIQVTLVRGAFNAAVLDRVVGASPFVRIALPRVERGRIVPITVEQVAALADGIGSRYRTMVIPGRVAVCALAGCLPYGCGTSPADRPRLVQQQRCSSPPRAVPACPRHDEA